MSFSSRQGFGALSVAVPRQSPAGKNPPVPTNKPQETTTTTTTTAQPIAPPEVFSFRPSVCFSRVFHVFSSFSSGLRQPLAAWSARGEKFLKEKQQNPIEEARESVTKIAEEARRRAVESAQGLKEKASDLRQRSSKSLQAVSESVKGKSQELAKTPSRIRRLSLGFATLLLGVILLVLDRLGDSLMAWGGKIKKIARSEEIREIAEKLGEKEEWPRGE